MTLKNGGMNSKVKFSLKTFLKTL